MSRILSIDDSKAVHAFIGSVLPKAEITHAYDGRKGIEALKALQPPPDLILLDWEMPELNGIETLKQIRASGCAIPVIMLTSRNAPEEISSALELGANEYVMKPFTPDILIEKIESVLGRKLG